MRKKEFPEKMTKENFPELVKKAKSIKKRAFWLLYAVCGLYVVGGLFLLLPLTFYLLGLLVKVTFPELSTEASSNVLCGVFLVVFPFAIYLFLDFIVWLFERFLGLPKSEEKVFASCFMIANHLMENEREKALKEVKDFSTYLSMFLSDRSKVKRKAYSKEFKLLIKGKTQIKRMILFSKEDMAKLFTNFGLSFVRGEDQKAFSNLTELVKEVSKYGKPKGRFSGFIASLNEIKYLLLFITAIGELVVVILKVIGAF